MQSLDFEEIFLDARAEQNIEKKPCEKRLMVFYCLIIAGLVLLLGKNFYLQILQKNYYTAMAEENRIQIQTTPALRGIIYDKNNKQLVKNILDQKNNKLIREYIYGENYAHLIGYTNFENKGQTGIELVYDKYLRGINGKKRIEKDVLGEQQRIVAIQEQEPGNNLILNIDIDLQNKLYQELPDAPSAGIALNAKNGAILALVSKPSFDANYFIENYQKLINNPDKPLFNRAISGQYPPGSTIKPMFALAALEQDLINPNKTIQDKKNLIIKNIYNPDIIYKFPDWKDHGLVNMVKAIKESCNIYFYQLSEKLGWENIKKYGKLFGFGQTQKIDLPNEESGFLPEKGWLGDLYHTVIGQGDLTATVLQIASYTSALANNGKIYQPQIVDKIVDSEDNLVKDILPKVIISNNFQEKNLNIIKQGMNHGFEYGKTGTAQFYPKSDKYHAWYTSFKDNLVLTILVERGVSGAQTAAPIAKKIIQWYDLNNN